MKNNMQLRSEKRSWSA